MRATTTIALVVSAALLAGCQQSRASASGVTAVASANSNPNDAIQNAIQAHVAHNSNLRLNSFDMEVKQVKFDEDHAQAQVEFRAKSGSGSMQLTYALAKRDGTWRVVESTPGGSNFSHPALGKTQGPSAGGKMGDNSDIFQVLDTLRGGAVAPAQTLPRGHPSVGAAPKEKQP
jgi:hypothetical protein